MAVAVTRPIICQRTDVARDGIFGVDSVNLVRFVGSGGPPIEYFGAPFNDCRNRVPTQSCGSTALPPSFAKTGSNGSSTRKQLPRPSWLETLTSALCAAQMALTMDSPSPAPPLARERALSAR